MLKAKFPPGIALWLKNDWNKREKFRKSSSLLVWDMFKLHKSEATKKKKKKKHLQRFDIDIAVISEGLTLDIQPLNVSLNKPFKGALREQWNQWMIDNEKTHTEKGNICDVPFETLSYFTLKA